MALDLSNLTKYVDEQRLPLISKLGLDTNSARDFEIQTGVKNEAALNLVNIGGDFQDGTACSFVDSGTTEFTQRNIKVGKIKVETSICQNKMLEYWMNYQVNAGANRRTLPFEEELANLFIADINDKAEVALWQGDTASGNTNPNTNKFDGLVTILSAATDVITASASTAATDYEQVMAVYKAIPSKSLRETVIYVDDAKFRALCAELTAKNLFHYVAEVDDKMEIKLPGTNTLVRGRIGLNGADVILAIVPRHTFVGVDLQNDAEDLKIWYSEDNDAYRFRAAFNLGVQVAYPSECVILSY